MTQCPVLSWSVQAGKGQAGMGTRAEERKMWSSKGLPLMGPQLRTFVPWCLQRCSSCSTTCCVAGYTRPVGCILACSLMVCRQEVQAVAAPCPAG